MAIRVGKRAALGEAAPIRQKQRVGHLAVDRRQTRLFTIQPRDGTQQAHRVRVLRRVEQGGYRPLLDDAPGVHYHYLIGHFSHHTEVMGDQDDGGAIFLLQCVHQIQDLGLDGDVERGGRLVGNQQARFAGQCHRNHGALAHATGQLVRVFVKALLGRRYAHLGQHLNSPLSRLRTTQRAVAH